MKESNGQKLLFSRSNQRTIEADFEGSAVSSDGGLLIMREADRYTGLIGNIATKIEDSRQTWKVQHEVGTLIRQRVFALAAGWEDLNDAEALRHDAVHHVASGSDEVLASASILCRFENGQHRRVALAVNADHGF